MAAKKRRRKRKKKIEASKKLAYWAASVATLSAASSLLLSAFGRDPVGELTGTIFTACVGYLITYAGRAPQGARGLKFFFHRLFEPCLAVAPRKGRVG